MKESFKQYVIDNYIKFNYQKYIKNKTSPLGDMYLDVASKLGCNISEPVKITYNYNTKFTKVSTNKGVKNLCYVDYDGKGDNIIYMTKKGNLLSYNVVDKKLKSFKDKDLNDLKKLNFIKLYRENKKFKTFDYNNSYILIDNDKQLFIKDDKFYDENKKLISMDNDLYDLCKMRINELNK